MTEHTEIQSLQEELEQFKKEKEAIRNLVGQIGGNTSSKRYTIVNITFFVLIAFLFLVDFIPHILEIDLNIPEIFSLQLGILLVSMKIMWMMHNQTKVFHFQFWILNSIEFRLNDISKKVNKIKKKIE